MYTFRETLHIVGAGSVGSHVAYHVGKRGSRHVLPVRVHDCDVVEERNCESSAYVRSDVGLRKVEVIARSMRAWGWPAVTPSHGDVTERCDLDGFVITALDTMEARRKLWHSSIKENERVLWLIDIRVDTATGLIYTLNMRRKEDKVAYEDLALYASSDDSTRRSCGEAMTKGPMPDFAASLAYFQLLGAFAAEAREPVSPAFRLEARGWPLPQVTPFARPADLYR